MTNEEAIIELSVLWERNGEPTDGRYREALDMAIEALEGADLDGYSSRLWKAAYERGKAEAKAESEEV